MSLNEQINQVRRTLSTVEALLVQAEENLKGCQQTQQTRLELAKAQIEYRLVKNATETLQNQMASQELTKKQQESEIKTVNKRLNQLHNDIAALTRQKVSMHRGLRALGSMWGNRRQLGLHRQRGRIIGVPAGAAPTECESSCGLTDTEIDFGTIGYATYSLCSKVATLNVALATVTLNLAAAASVVIMAAIVAKTATVSRYQIQRPLGTNVTDQRAVQMFGRISNCGDTLPALHEVEACESLPAGIYSWFLVPIASTDTFAWWMKAREITCLAV